MMIFGSIIKKAYAQGVDIGGSKGAYAFGNFQNFGAALQPLVNPMFAIAGTIVFVYFIVGAFRMVTSNGDKNIIASAREEMYHGIIGFILLILLFLVVRYLPAFFLGKGAFSLIKFTP